MLTQIRLGDITYPLRVPGQAVYHSVTKCKDDYEAVFYLKRKGESVEQTRERAAFGKSADFAITPVVGAVAPARMLGFGVDVTKNDATQLDRLVVILKVKSGDRDNEKKKVMIMASESKAVHALLTRQYADDDVMSAMQSMLKTVKETNRPEPV